MIGRLVVRFRRWRAIARARRDAYVRCEGDMASYPLMWDYEVCFKDGCTWPSGGPCLAAQEEERRLQELLEKRGLS